MIKFGTEETPELTPQEKARRALEAGEVVLDLPWSPRRDGIRPEDAGL